MYVIICIYQNIERADKKIRVILLMEHLQESRVFTAKSWKDCFVLLLTSTNSWKIRYGGFLKQGYPKIIHVHVFVFHDKPSFWGYPNSWKPEYGNVWTISGKTHPTESPITWKCSSPLSWWAWSSIVSWFCEMGSDLSVLREWGNGMIVNSHYG